MQSKYLPSAACLILTNKDVCMASKEIKCSYSASFSAIMTIAEYMCEQYPDLAPPGFPENLKPDPTERSLEDKLVIKIYFQPWCDYLNTLINPNHQNGQIIEKDQTMYFICRLPDPYFQSTRETLSQNFPQIPPEKVQSLLQFQLESQKKHTIKVGIINFGTSQLKNDPLAPKVNLLSLFTGIWFRHGDIWRRFDVLKGEYPSQGDVLDMDVFVLSGSTLSVNDGNQAVAKVMTILKEGLGKNKKLKILGLCFGHQAVAKHFGGEVIRKQTYSGIQVINFQPNLLQNKSYPYLSPLTQSPIYTLCQFHSDYVSVLPPNFHNLAHSQSTQNEGMISQDGRCLTFQFHSEYTLGYIKQFQEKLKKISSMGVPGDYKPRLEAVEKYGVGVHVGSCGVVREVVRRFMEYQG